MKCYCISDIHGCLDAFEEALSRFMDNFEADSDAKIILLGDYIHGGDSSKEVLDRIISLQESYGSDRVIALAGNHDIWVIDGSANLDHPLASFDDPPVEQKYINWISSLPLYHIEGKTLFLHAGIDEEAGEYWEWGTGEDMFTMKFPAQTGKIEGIDMKVVAGHVGTSSIAGDPNFHDIYFDGESHYYIDGTVLKTGYLNVLMVDTETDKYYRVTDCGPWFILPYDEEN